MRTLTRTGTGGGTVFTVKDTEGNATTFAYASGTGTASTSNAWRYRVDTVTQPGAGITTTTLYNGDGTPLRLAAPIPQGQDCSDDAGSATFGPGCRAVKFFYGNGKITSVGLKVGLADSSIVTTEIACYSYDGTGRLHQAWDPRVNGTSCGAPVLPVTYTYDTSTGTPNSGKITSVAPPGQAPWKVGYTGGSGTDPYTGQLDTVSRTHNAANGGGSETFTVRYRVPFTRLSCQSERDQTPREGCANWNQA